MSARRRARRRTPVAVMAAGATLLVAGCGVGGPLDGVEGADGLRDFAEHHLVVLPEELPGGVRAVDARSADGLSYFELTLAGLAPRVAVCVGTWTQCEPAVEGELVREGSVGDMPFCVLLVGDGAGLASLTTDQSAYWLTTPMSRSPEWVD